MPLEMVQRSYSILVSADFAGNLLAKGSQQSVCQQRVTHHDGLAAYAHIADIAQLGVELSAGQLPVGVLLCSWQSWCR